VFRIHPFVFRLAVIALGAITPPMAAAQFAPDDQVRLRRDEPLYFKGSVFREGKAGESFQVLKYDPLNSRVFLMATGSDGKTFALNCSDQALEPMRKDYWALLQQGIRMMQQGDMAGARMLFVKAATADRVDKTAVGLALHCEAMSKAATDLSDARLVLGRTKIEVSRILRNAQVTDRPDRLGGGNGNQIRAEELRTQARNLKEQAELAVTKAEASLEEAATAANATADALLTNGSLSLGLPMSDSIARFASKLLPHPLPQTKAVELNRAEITARINAASDALKRAQAFFDARELRAAQKAITAGLTAEPGRGELKQLQTEVELRLNKVATLRSLAASLKEQNRLDESLADIAKAEALCADDADLRAFAEDLRRFDSGLNPGSVSQKPR